jgi:hypothetical protein
MKKRTRDSPRSTPEPRSSPERLSDRSERLPERQPEKREDVASKVMGMLSSVASKMKGKTEQETYISLPRHSIEEDVFQPGGIRAPTSSRVFGQKAVVARPGPSNLFDDI